MSGYSKNVRFSANAVIAAVVAIGEEIFFRGVIQTHFGLIDSKPNICYLCIFAIYFIGIY